MRHQREGLVAARENDAVSIATAQQRVQKPAPIEVASDRPFTEAVRDYEIRLIRTALKNARFNQRAAARALGLTYHQFRGLYRKHRTELD